MTGSSSSADRATTARREYISRQQLASATAGVEKRPLPTIIVPSDADEITNSLSQPLAQLVPSGWHPELGTALSSHASKVPSTGSTK